MAVALLIGILAVQLLVAKCHVAVSRPFWFDEIITYRIASDASLSHALKALADGVDFNPPAFHVLSHFALQISPFSPETTLRLLPLLAMWGALVGLYFVLRPSFSPAVAVAIVLATEASAVVTYQMFEARFYALWSAAIVWYCFFLQRAAQRQSHWPVVGLAVTSVLVCTTHYFGVVSLVLATAAHFLVQWPQVERRRSLWLAILAGPVALATCTPMYLGQRAALTVPTWIEPLNMAQVIRLFDEVYPIRTLTALAGAWWLGQLLPGLQGKESPAAEQTRSLAGLSGLLLMPAFLVIFSWLVQPTVVPRYAIAAVFGATPVMAMLLAQSWPRLVVVALPFFLFSSLMMLSTNVRLAQQTTAEQQALHDTLIRCAGSGPIVFEEPHDIFPAALYQPEQAGRFYFLDFETDQLPQARPFQIVNRDVVRRHVAHYPTVALLPLSRLQQYDQLYLVVGKGTRAPGPEFARFHKKQLAGRVWELHAKSAE